ncbi:MAG TPA: hypothetical protein VH561_20465 [Micromonosporaceae bacterium]|jgi:hypothetical protein
MHDSGDGGGGGPSYDSFAQPKVELNIHGMIDFYLAMMGLQGDAANHAMMSLVGMEQQILDGLHTPNRLGQVFPEGAEVARRMYERHSDFNHFFADVVLGLQSIGSAAGVVAEMYGHADFDNNMDISKISFAFADPNTNPPPGFRDYQTLYETRDQDQGGNAYAMALNESGYTQSIYPARGVSVFLYPDGSTRQVVSQQYSDGHTVTETTVYANGTLVQKTTVTTNTDKYGNQVQVTETTDGDTQNGRTVTSTQETDPLNGKLKITYQTTVVVDGKTLPPDPATSVEIGPDDHTGHQDPDPAGPIENAQLTLHTQGSDYEIQEGGADP